MSYQKFSRWLSVDRVDVSLAKLGILLSVLLLGLRLLASQVFLLVIPVAVGTGSVLYLLILRSRESHVVSGNSQSLRVSSPTLPRSVAGYLPSVVVLGLAALTLSIRLVGTRTDPIYLLTGAVGVAIFAQILFVGDERIAPGLVLGQILGAAVVIQFTALYATPGFVGVDIWTHVTVFVEGIAREGSLSPLAGDKYVMAPIYHVIGAVGALALGGARNGVYLTVGLLVPLSALFVYATGALMLSARWALLATAFYVFSDQVIRWGMHVIPTSLGLVFFVAAVYAITRLFYADAERWAIGLLFASSLAIVYTHQVSTAVVLILLGVATVVAVAASAGGGATPSTGVRKALALGSVFAVTLGATLASWAVTPFSGGGDGSSFLWGELAVVSEIVTENAGFLNLASESGDAAQSVGGPAEAGTLFAALIPYVELFGFSLLLLAAIVGGLYMFRWDGAPDFTFTHLLTGAGLFVIVFGLSLFGIRALLPGRWLAFLYVSMALLGAVGLSYVSRTGSRRVVLVVFLLVAVGYPTTMVVAEKATLDSPAFEDQHKRFAYTQPEISAVGTISELNPPAPDRTLATDHPYVTLFRRTGGYGYGASIVQLGAAGPEEADAVVYREYQSTGPATFRGSTASPGAQLTGDVEGIVCPHGWNSGYANDEVKLCTPSGVTGGSR